MEKPKRISDVENESEMERLNHINQMILDSVAEGIYGIDLNAKVIFWNKAAEELTGFTMKDFEHDNLHDLIHHTNPQGEHVPLHQCPVYHALNSGESLFVKDDIFWKKDGTSFPVEYTVKPMFEKGHFAGTVITFRDMTEKKQTEEILLKWEKMSLIGQMAASVAHEIRNPMTSLKGFIQLMKSTKEFNQNYFDIIDSEIHRIDTIIQELLMFSKPQKVSYKKLDIKELIYQVVILMEPQAITKNISILQDVDCSPVEVYCIEHQLKQVFMNLIKNAIEAMDNGGNININVFQKDQEVKIKIIDNGPGMTQDTIKKLGEPFYSTKKSGTGLGIMVTNNILKNNHQGTLHVESMLGYGSTFTITLPVKPTFKN